MRSACLLLLVMLLAVFAAPTALATGGASSPTPLSPAPASPAPSPPTPAVLPASLLALEQKMGELQLTSLRFTLHTSFTLPHANRKLLRFLKLFSLGDSSGEETISPPAANVTLDFFGHPLTLRLVGNTTYVYIHALAAHDHGRPWVKLGPAGFGELFEVNGKPPPKTTVTSTPSFGAPALAEPPFAKLKETLAAAKEVREVGAETLYGQSVVRFLAVLDPTALKGDPLAASSRLVPIKPAPPSTSTLEVALAASGMPVRMVFTEGEGGTTTTAVLDIPAVNYSLTIEVPPADRTIDLAQERALERRLKRHTHRRHQH